MSILFQIVKSLRSIRHCVPFVIPNPLSLRGTKQSFFETATLLKDCFVPRSDKSACFMLLMYLKSYFQFVLLILRSLFHCVPFVIAFHLSLRGTKNLSQMLWDSSCVRVTKVRVFTACVFEILFSICSLVIAFPFSLRAICHWVPFVIACHLSFWRRKNLNCKCCETLPASEWQKCGFLLPVCLKSYFQFVLLLLRSLFHCVPFVIECHLSLRAICHSDVGRISIVYFNETLPSSEWQ